MLIFKLIYLAIAAVSAAFFVLYRDILSFILFLVILAVPVLLLLIVIGMRLGLRVSCECEESAASAGQKAHLSFKVSNYFIFPITQLTLYIRCQNSFFEKPDRLELNFYASPFTKNVHDIEIDSEHTGNVEVYVTKAKVFDYFGIFSLPVRIKKKYTVTFLPKTEQLDIAVNQNIHSLSESNLFSKHKPGDDPSEVFAIRDYVPGDKPNHIHWKLSSKQDSLIVKDYSLPISKSVMLLPELFISGNGADAALVDTVFEIVTSISHTLIDAEIQHSIGWYNPRDKVYCTQEINGYDGLYATLRLIFESAKHYYEPHLASMPEQYQTNISNIVYVSPNISSDHLDALAFSRNPNALCTAVNVVPKESDGGNLTSDDVEVVTVKEGMVFECLNETFI
ncbi:MAG: DUF58 domain-containing protein [Oscillospiraceae bacterium]|nr:DUF58 domain-containing protein [Oscillospiraceae bacterium]